MKKSIEVKQDLGLKKICLSPNCCYVDLPRWASINPIEIAAFLIVSAQIKPQIDGDYFEKNMITNEPYLSLLANVNC